MLDLLSFFFLDISRPSPSFSNDGKHASECRTEARIPRRGSTLLEWTRQNGGEYVVWDRRSIVRGARNVRTRERINERAGRFEPISRKELG